MASFLEIVNDVERESGTVARGQRTADVAVPITDRHEKIVDWVREAWVLIQESREDWRFSGGDFAAQTVAGQPRYTGAGWTLPRFDSFSGFNADSCGYSIYDTAIGRADEGSLYRLTWNQWAQSYDRGIVPQQRPTEWAISPAGELCLGVTPDRAYTVRGTYRKAAQVLLANDDVPDMPVRFHNIIAYRALILLGEHDESPVTVASAQKKYAVAHSNLVNHMTARTDE